jgi:deazaflavin-dependent oxidoreductase (nitroreductase family)
MCRFASAGGSMHDAVAKGFNVAVVALQQIGIVYGPQRILTVAGRKSGAPRVAPIAVQTLGGNEYVWQAFPKASWVANVRAADTVDLARGRRHRTVRFVEIQVPERRQLLLELARQMPKVHRDRMVTNGLAATNSPEAIAAAAGHIAVFRIDNISADDDVE